MQLWTGLSERLQSTFVPKVSLLLSIRPRAIGFWLEVSKSIKGFCFGRNEKAFEMGIIEVQLRVHVHLQSVDQHNSWVAESWVDIDTVHSVMKPMINNSNEEKQQANHKTLDFPFFESKI